MPGLGHALAALYGWPLLILAFGIYSITRLITKDSIIDGLRDKFFDRFPREGVTLDKRPKNKRVEYVIISGGKFYVNKGTWLGELVHCPWCMGFWVSAAVCLSFWAWPVVTTALLVPMALRVVPGIIESVID